MYQKSSSFAGIMLTPAATAVDSSQHSLGLFVVVVVRDAQDRYTHMHPIPFPALMIIIVMMMTVRKCL